MLRAPFTLDLFRRATESTRRLVMFIIFEGVFVAIGLLLALFVLPRLRSVIDEANLPLHPLVEAAITHYWIIVAALLVHALLSGPLMPRMPRGVLALWLALAALLPMLIVIVPALAVIASYSAILGDLAR